MIKVLIVEDDPMVMEFNRRYLERIDGFVLEASASSMEEALKILDSRDIDLILLDIYMPGRNGLELLSQIRKMGHGIDVIVISAACDNQSIKMALRYGAVDYLIKPFEFERFKAALTTYREEAKFMEVQDMISQEDLDKLIFHKEPAAAPDDLPKGLTRSTLALVWEKIQAFEETDFSTEELANSVGISRVSIRKYLQFLVEIGLLKLETNYGTIGRPVYMHRYIPSKSHLIKNYL
ncbi:two-component system response regulator DcuR [Ammoniphilus sp. 3BR4]|uniref:two-component system response regulator DcuR n=1 Tax=Ammoniphilus sp. 3BR4 TaxID=3158265 RepID=UPI003467C61E